MDWGRLVHEQYERHFRLHKAGEWTVVAGILLLHGDETRVVALGAGVKCLPLKCYDSDPLRYQLVRDMHAEVLARRALIAYLAAQVEAAREGRDSILACGEDGCRLKPGYSFGMYVSQSPCGDASMHILQPHQQPAEAPAKRPRTVRGREEVAVRGVLRTKPGRRDAPPAPSLSCSDKIALWSSVGWQGAILGAQLCGQIVVDDFLIGERFDGESLTVGIVDKIANKAKPTFRQYTGEPFRYSFETVTSKHLEAVPASVAQIWYEGGGAETVADGRKLGAAKPKDGVCSKKSQSAVSTERIAGMLSLSNVVEAKQANVQYQRRKAELFGNGGPLHDWPQSNAAMVAYRKDLQ